MCYHVFTHTFRCGTSRPLLHNGSAYFVDSYADPLLCDCPQESMIPPFLRCPYHGCCWLTKMIIPCGPFADCPHLISCNLYKPSVAAHQIMGDQTLSPVAWDKIRVFDGRYLQWEYNLGNKEVPAEGVEFWQVLSCLLSAGRALAFLNYSLWHAQQIFERLFSAWLDCGACRTINDLSECHTMGRCPRRLEAERQRCVISNILPRIELFVQIYRDCRRALIELRRSRRGRRVTNAGSAFITTPKGSGSLRPCGGASNNPDDESVIPYMKEAYGCL
jgi:hypothetical protein